MAPVLVPLRPSNEHILIVRVPGARDQHGCHFAYLLLSGKIRSQHKLDGISAWNSTSLYLVSRGEVVDDPSTRKLDRKDHPFVIQENPVVRSNLKRQSPPTVHICTYK